GRRRRRGCGCGARGAVVARDVDRGGAGAVGAGAGRGVRAVVPGADDPAPRGRARDGRRAVRRAGCGAGPGGLPPGHVRGRGPAGGEPADAGDAGRGRGRSGGAAAPPGPVRPSRPVDVRPGDVATMRPRNLTVLALSLTVVAGACSAGASGPEAPAPVRAAAGADPRVGLRGGWLDAESAASNLTHLAHHPPSDGFSNPRDPGDFAFASSDLAFQGNLVFQGSYNGFQVWDISDPRNPRLRASLVCPGGQGDLSVYGNLLFMSAEGPRGRVGCGPQGVSAPASRERFLGVRLFDITDIENPRQVAAVQTCRGSHTHTLVTDPNDA